jgi:hypothetical protein
VIGITPKSVALEGALALSGKPTRRFRGGLITLALRANLWSSANNRVSWMSRLRGVAPEGVLALSAKPTRPFRSGLIAFALRANRWSRPCPFSVADAIAIEAPGGRDLRLEGTSCHNPNLRRT